MSEGALAGARGEVLRPSEVGCDVSERTPFAHVLHVEILAKLPRGAASS